MLTQTALHALFTRTYARAFSILTHAFPFAGWVRFAVLTTTRVHCRYGPQHACPMACALPGWKDRALTSTGTLGGMFRQQGRWAMAANISSEIFDDASNNARAYIACRKPLVNAAPLYLSSMRSGDATCSSVLAAHYTYRTPHLPALPMMMDLFVATATVYTRHALAQPRRSPEMVALGHIYNRYHRLDVVTPDRRSR